ncbi:hypothetical protein BH11VER1_BH11VER1_09720 [soil metagenome]
MEKAVAKQSELLTRLDREDEWCDVLQFPTAASSLPSTAAATCAPRSPTRSVTSDESSQADGSNNLSLRRTLRNRQLFFHSCI